MRKIQLLVLVLVCFAFAGCRSTEQKCDDELMPAREFNSKLSLSVCTVDETGEWNDVGNTPSDKALKIPACSYWMVVPIGNTGLADLVTEVKNQNIPGVILSSISDSDLVAVKELQGLQMIVLCGTQITGAGLAHIKDLKNLKVLDLFFSEITDASLASIKDMKNLRSLDLSYTKITDAGLVHIKDLKNLRQLNLRNTAITRAGLVYIKDMKELELLE